MPTELSDAEVFGASPPGGGWSRGFETRELSDADVFGPPPDPSGIVIPNRFTKHTGQVNPATLPRTIEDARALLAPEPGWNASALLPLAMREGLPGSAAGKPMEDIRYDPVAPLRGPGNAILDLFEGTKTGRVTPEASVLLGGAAAGRMLPPSVAHGTGSAIAQTAEHGAPISSLFAKNQPRDGVPVTTAPGSSLVPIAPPQQAPFRVLGATEPPSPAAPASLLALPPPSTIPPDPTASVAPAPQSVGAASSREMSDPPLPPKTKVEALNDMQKAVLQSAEDRIGPTMRDDTIHIPGVRRTLATRHFTPENALDDKVFRATDPAYRRAAEAIERENNDVLKDAFLTHAGDPNALGVAYAEREAVSPTALRVFEGEAPVDASPLLTEINQVLAGPEGRRDAIKRIFTGLRNALVREGDDVLAMDPSHLYGYRKDVTDKLKKGATGSGDEAADMRTAKELLTQLLPTIDATITTGAPKFGDYLAQWAALSKPIDQMEFLQKYLTGSGKIVNDQGYLLPNRVQKLLTDIYEGQKARGGNKAKTLTSEQIDTIEGIRNELAYVALRDRNASVRGSDTTQQANRTGIMGDGPLGRGLRGAAEVGAHLALAPTTGGVGNAALMGWRQVVKPMRDAANEKFNAARTAQRKAELLATE